MEDRFFAQKALIVKDGHILLIQKDAQDPYHPNKWEVPGGRWKKGENPDEHIQREVFEEVGLHITPGRPLSMWWWTLGDKPGSPMVVAVARECSITDRDVSITFAGHDAGDHIGRWEWVPFDKVASFDLIPDARKAILEALEVLIKTC